MGLMGILAVAGMAMQVSQQKKVQQQMQKAQESQRRLQEIQMEREQARLQAEQQQQQASMTAAAAAQGVAGSSMEQAAQASLQTQLSTELSFLDQTAQLQQQQAAAQSNINKIQGQTQLMSSVFDVASSYAGGMSQPKQQQGTGGNIF